MIDEKGKSLGEISNTEALEIAKGRELDLVEVSPKTQPPVCRITDYGKLQYQRNKQERVSKTKQRKVETKGIRIGIRTDEHDIVFKKNQAEKFLKKGNKVKIEIRLRGREKAHQDLARESLNNFTKRIETPYRIDEDVKKFPQGFNIVIAPE
ncbi:translation initiation factor IF-3 [bacterium BMS3Abin15]|nr:translation initiation factor IF-3 [bacterium BMS3Abin15]